MSRPSLHSDDLAIRQDEESDDWQDLGLIAGVLFGLGCALLVVELCRLPVRLWRAVR